MIPLNHRECRWAYGNIERYFPRNSTSAMMPEKIFFKQDTDVFFFGEKYFSIEDGDCYPDIVSLNFFHRTSPPGHLSWLLPHQQTILPFLQTILPYDGQGYSGSVPSVDSFNSSTFIFSTLFFCSHSLLHRMPPSIQFLMSFHQRCFNRMRSLSAVLALLLLSGTPRSP